MSAIGPQFYEFLKKLDENNGKLPTSVTTRAFQPEFEFNNSTCYLCNGYYGPSFGEPVCVTCHEFLYPDIPHHLPNSYILSEKTDDGDSGNDEPSVGELLYNDRRLTKALQQQGVPKWAFRFQNSLDSEASPDGPDDPQNAREDWMYVSNSRSAGSIEGSSRENEGPSGSQSGSSDHREGPISEVPSSSSKHGAIPKSRYRTSAVHRKPASGDHVNQEMSCQGEPKGKSPPRLPKTESNTESGGSSSAGPSSTPKEGPSYGPSEGASFGPGEGSSSSSLPRELPSGSNSGPNLFSPSRSTTGFKPGYNRSNGPNYGAVRQSANSDPNDDSSDDSPIDDRAVPYQGPMDYFYGGRLIPNRRLVYDDGLGPAVPDDGVIRPLPSCLTRSIAALSTPRPPDNIAPGLVESLPSEVVLCMFGYLDDLSLSACARVCVRWAQLVRARVPPPRWAAAAVRRWPLFLPHVRIHDWHKKYQALVESCFCRNCVVQMCMQSQPPFEENAWRRNRLRNEIKMLRNTPPEGCAATPLDPKCCHWQAMVTGPGGSPYEGGIFYLYIQVPYSYPMSPPVVRFLTRILHPNVSRHGDVGIDSVHHNWSLALTISKLLISIQSLLTDPYTAVCMEPEVGDMYVNERARFERIARRWTWRYAMHDMYSI